MSNDQKMPRGDLFSSFIFACPRQKREQKSRAAPWWRFFCAHTITSLLKDKETEVQICRSFIF
jgi:hypothetical protein